MYDITAQATQSLTESSQFKTAGLSVENQISMAQYIRDYLLNDTKLRDLIPANVAITNVSISDQIKNYNELMLRRDKLAGNASSNSPVIQDFDSELAALRRAIIASLQSHISTLEIQLNNIRREESLARTRIASATRQSTELLDNTRQQRIKEELYLYLLNKREENELTKAIADNNARIIDPAYGSSTPVAPRSVIILFIALLFGLATPFGIIYLMEILDTTIRGRKDIEDKLSIPFLGDIPEYHGSTRQGSVVVRDNGRDSVSEAFRLIRSNLGFMSVKSGKLQIIMVTSSDPHAGKTFVTTNLAMTLALADKKVVIVDLDLRRRTLSKQMGQRDNRNGVSGYISGTIANLNDIVFQSGLHENLDIILRRSATAQPGRNAPVGEVRRIHGRPARQRYDYVVIDSAPAMARGRRADYRPPGRPDCIYVDPRGTARPPAAARHRTALPREEIPQHEHRAQRFDRRRTPRIRLRIWLRIRLWLRLWIRLRRRRVAKEVLGRHRQPLQSHATADRSLGVMNDKTVIPQWPSATQQSPSTSTVRS